MCSRTQQENMKTCVIGTGVVWLALPVAIAPAALLAAIAVTALVL